MDRRAYGYAFLAIGCWGSLATGVGDSLRTVPPFQALCYDFVFASATILAVHRFRHGLGGLRPPPAPTFAVGLWGVTGYHILYFLALKHAPVVEASIVNYLWPLLIVVFAALFGGERFRPATLAGALFGCAGTVLALTGGRGLSGEAAYLPGYAAAFGAALAWSSFSVLLKRMRPGGPSDMFFYCLATALAGGALMAVTGQTGALTVRQVLTLVYTGVFPLGLAFYSWERAIHIGDVQTVGALSYLTPFLSTFLLWAVLGAPVSAGAAGGLALIVVGAAVGSGISRSARTGQRIPL